MYLGDTNISKPSTNIDSAGNYQLNINQLNSRYVAHNFDNFDWIPQDSWYPGLYFNIPSNGLVESDHIKYTFAGWLRPRYGVFLCEFYNLDNALEKEDISSISPGTSIYHPKVRPAVDDALAGLLTNYLAAKDVNCNPNTVNVEVPYIDYVNGSLSYTTQSAKTWLPNDINVYGFPIMPINMRTLNIGSLHEVTIKKLPIFDFYQTSDMLMRSVFPVEDNLSNTSLKLAYHTASSYCLHFIENTNIEEISSMTTTLCIYCYIWG